MKYLIPFTFLLFLNCQHTIESKPTATIQEQVAQDTTVKVNYFYKPDEMILSNRFPAPFGFERTDAEANSFAAFLRNFKLLHDSCDIMFFDGSRKFNQDGKAAILDIDVGKRDLQQCADAVMRLRAEYLFAHKRFDEIHFNLTNGFRMDYSKWRKGYRLQVNGNTTKWQKRTYEDTSYAAFRKYLNKVYMYAGSYSLSKELKPKPLTKIEPGDVWIQGGFPGHAVIVMDVAQHPESGERKFMLAQSYMPAQSIHLLNNPDAHAKEWCWFSNKDLNTLVTPDWTFSTADLKTW